MGAASGPGTALRCADGSPCCRSPATPASPSYPSNHHLHRYEPSDETFRITLANLPQTSAPHTVGAYEPRRDEDVPARLIPRRGAGATFEIQATDHARLLDLEYAHA